jgi:hypothetical protein
MAGPPFDRLLCESFNSIRHGLASFYSWLAAVPAFAAFGLGVPGRAAFFILVISHD